MKLRRDGDAQMGEDAAAAARLRGGCLCGAVGYEVRNEFVYAANCHCSQCRRATGAAFKPFAGIERHKLALTRGADRVLRFGGMGDAAHDVRCGTCGSLLYSVVRDGGYVHVAMGTLIDAPSIRPTAHIFASSRAPWDVIADDLPQYDGYGQ